MRRLWWMLGAQPKRKTWVHRRRPLPPGTRLLLIERRAMRKPIIVEIPPGQRRALPTGFWRGREFYHITRILGRRFETGVAFVRVRTYRGCFELRRTLEVDPWTFVAHTRWELTAELDFSPLVPHPS